jgi:hypothetical protein
MNFKIFKMIPLSLIVSSFFQYNHVPSGLRDHIVLAIAFNETDNGTNRSHPKVIKGNEPSRRN